MEDIHRAIHETVLDAGPKQLAHLMSTSQTAFLVGVEMQGYMGVVCRGFDEARQVIEGYMAMPQTMAMPTENRAGRG